MVPFYDLTQSFFWVVKEIYYILQAMYLHI